MKEPDRTLPHLPPWQRLRPLGRTVLGQLLPRACLLCNAPCAHEPLCLHCRHALPGLDEPRCPICALPSRSHQPGIGTQNAPDQPVILNEACNLATEKTPAAASSACPLRQRLRPHLDRIICLADYAPPLDQALGSLKFGQQAALGFSLGELLMQKIACLPDAPLSPLDALIPVPLSGARLAERGFNQSHQIARGMRACSGQRLPAIQTGWLRRLRDTTPQSSLSAHERQRNLTDAFGASPRVSGKRIALIDDVMTTGSTLVAAAAALKTAGAIQVIALIIARTPDPGHQPAAAPP